MQRKFTIISYFQYKRTVKKSLHSPFKLVIYFSSDFIPFVFRRSTTNKMAPNNMAAPIPMLIIFTFDSFTSGSIVSF